MKTSLATLVLLFLGPRGLLAGSSRRSSSSFEHRRLARSAWEKEAAPQSGPAYDTCVQQCMGDSWNAETDKKKPMMAHADDYGYEAEAGAVASHSTTSAAADETPSAAYGYPSSSSSWSSALAAPSAPPAVPPATNASEGLLARPYQVVVAPKKGDLRMVPFNIVAPAGTNISFIWGAGPHTVTESSALTICNASQAPDAFKSGQQNQGFEWNVEIKTSSPKTYFCGVPTHCQKGMFGLINGQVATIPDDGFGAAMPRMAANDSKFADLWNETKTMCKGNDRAWKWGDQIATSNVPEWAMSYAAENIMYTRQFFATFPEALPSSTSSSTNNTSSSTPPKNPSSPTTTDGVSSNPSAADPSASSSSTTNDSIQLKPVGVGLALLLAGLSILVLA